MLLLDHSQTARRLVSTTKRVVVSTGTLASLLDCNAGWLVLGQPVEILAEQPA
jgi:hypothetical protein